MRTTIRLDDQLLQQTKEYAARTGRTLTSVIEDSLREMFARQRISDQKRPVKFTIVSGNGLQPGVDLDDSAALLDLMDGIDGSS
jgi:hypothetical protein